MIPLLFTYPSQCRVSEIGGMTHSPVSRHYRSDEEPTSLSGLRMTSGLPPRFEKYRLSD